VTRRLALAGLAFLVFVVSAVMLHIAFLAVAIAIVAVFGTSCGDNCHTHVYLGPGFFIVTLVGAIAIAIGVVRYAAGKTTRDQP
jgi:hypothetical protein